MALNFSGLYDFGNPDPPQQTTINFDPTDFDDDQTPNPPSDFTFDPTDIDPSVYEDSILAPGEPIGDPDEFYKEYWNAYQGWHASAGQEYEAKVHTEMARLAASGLRKDSTEWTRAVDYLDIWYEGEISELQDSDTYRNLTSAYGSATVMGSKFHTDSLGKWYGDAFGNPLEEPSRIVERGGVSDVFSFESEEEAGAYREGIAPFHQSVPFIRSGDPDYIGPPEREDTPTNFTGN